MDVSSLVTSTLLGAAVGDAYGVPYEFLSRREIARLTLGGMTGNDCDDVPASRWGDLIPAGSWSDDTSMSVATMEAIVACGGTLDFDRIMRSFVSWWDEGRYTAHDYPFGLGTTVDAALFRYHRGTPALRCGGTGVRDNGNGSLMRAFPLALWCLAHELSVDETVRVMSDASALTHGHDISKMACTAFALLFRWCVDTGDPREAQERLTEVDFGQWFSLEACEALGRVTSPGFGRLVGREDIDESGYVVCTLEGALHSVLHGFEQGGYRETVLECVRLGYDTDTTACVGGALAGALYGVEGIPEEWLAVLRKRAYLEDVAARFAAAVG